MSRSLDQSKNFKRSSSHKFEGEPNDRELTQWFLEVQMKEEEERIAKLEAKYKIKQSTPRAQKSSPDEQELAMIVDCIEKQETNLIKSESTGSQTANRESP